LGASPTTGILISSTTVALGSKGAWAVIATSSQVTREISFLAFCTVNNSSNNRHAVDVGIGTAGSETVLIQDILIDCSRANQVATPYIPFWVTIPSSTRISARMSASSSAATINSYILFGSAGFGSPNSMGSCWTYGSNSTAARGTSVDPGAVANTKGAYSVLATSSQVTRNIRAITIVTGQQMNAAQTTARWQIDVSIGTSAGAEKIIFGDLPMVTNTTPDQMTPQVYGPFSVNIPSSSRLSARACSSTTDATDRLFDMVIYGMG
jgi:hypothetical protein